MREHAVLLKEISDYLDGVPENTNINPKALATEFAARYFQPPLDRVGAHIIDQMKMRQMSPESYTYPHCPSHFQCLAAIPR